MSQTYEGKIYSFGKFPMFHNISQNKGYKYK